MDTLHQLVPTRKEYQTYYDRPLSCNTDYSGISDDGSFSSSSSSFCDHGRRGRDEPNVMAFGWFDTRNKNASAAVRSTIDDCLEVSERCDGGSVLVVDKTVLQKESFQRHQGSGFSGVALRRLRRRKLATVIPTRKDLEESPTALLQKCRSEVSGDPTGSTSTVHHHQDITRAQSALLLSRRRFHSQSARKTLLENKCMDEDDFQMVQNVHGVGKWGSKRNVEGKTDAASAVKTESVEDHSSDRSTAGSLWMTEESLLEEASQQSEASLQVLLRHIFSWDRDVWCR